MPLDATNSRGNTMASRDNMYKASFCASAFVDGEGVDASVSMGEADGAAADG